jgi:beta-lactamase superfamily II metal-dependent hydrolase
MNCEIEFLPVGDNSRAGDAIVVRYGNEGSYKLMLIDGGHAETGQNIVEHIRAEFGWNSVLSHVVLTHPDGDHASGLREVLSELTVEKLWLHLPWLSAPTARPYFADKGWTDEGLTKEIRGQYGIVDEIVTSAWENGSTKVYQPFAGSEIGPFRVLSPSKEAYPFLLPQFDGTPDPDQEAIEQAGMWIGKQPGAIARLWELALAKSAAKAPKWAQETWAYERLKDGGVTSASNESSVVLYADCEGSGRVLLTGDGGLWALGQAATYAARNQLALQSFSFVQIPHHGSRRNVGPGILNRLLGPVLPEFSEPRFSAFVSAPKDDDTHPRRIVLNAFLRRGARVAATQGVKRIYFGGFQVRPGYVGSSDGFTFSPEVEDYD